MKKSVILLGIQCHCLPFKCKGKLVSEFGTHQKHFLCTPSTQQIHHFRPYLGIFLYFRNKVPDQLKILQLSLKKAPPNLF